MYIKLFGVLVYTHWLEAIVLPGLISAVILCRYLWKKSCDRALSNVQIMHIPTSDQCPTTLNYLGQFFGLVLLGVVANSMFSFWSENGLHVVSVGSVLITLWCLTKQQSIVLVYPGTFFTVLGADLYVAWNHPDFPAGIGGAGFSDALFVFPLLFTGLAVFAWYLINKQKDLSY